MITFNGIKFAKNDKEFTNSLFNEGGTCEGFYKVTKRGVQLLDMQKNIIGFIVNNGYSQRFLVSATRLDGGRIHYMYGTSTQLDRFLNLKDLSYMGTIKECERIIEGVA